MSDKVEKYTIEEGISFLKHCKTVTKHKEAFEECGSALEAIRDGREYRRDYKTFEECCQKMWGWGRRHVNYLIEGSTAVKALPKSLGDLVPNPAAARAVVKVKPERRVAVLTRAAAKGSVTARTISEAASEMDSESAPASSDKKIIELDRVGYPVPDKCLKHWRRRGEIQDWMKIVSEVKCGIERAKKDNDLLYIEVRQSVIADLNMIREAISYALPYAVCTSCNGQLADKCTLCKGRGVISESLYKKVPSDIRAMREKMAKKGSK